MCACVCVSVGVWCVCVYLCARVRVCACVRGRVVCLCDDNLYIFQIRFLHLTCRHIKSELMKSMLEFRSPYLQPFLINISSNTMITMDLSGNVIIITTIIIILTALWMPLYLVINTYFVVIPLAIIYGVSRPPTALVQQVSTPEFL